MKMKSKLIPSLLLLAGFLVGASALSALAQISAPSNPPECPTTIPGCNPPINEGTISQDKKGPIRINTAIPGSIYGLDVWGIARFWDGFVIENRTSNPSTNLDTGRMWLITP